MPESKSGALTNLATPQLDTDTKINRPSVERTRILMLFIVRVNSKSEPTHGEFPLTEM